MFTYKQLTDYATRNDLRWEIHKTDLGFELGINNLANRRGASEWSWTWFVTYRDDVQDDTNFYFSHRYSMLNGKTYRSLSESMKARNIVGYTMQQLADALGYAL